MNDQDMLPDHLTGLVIQRLISVGLRARRLPPVFFAICPQLALKISPIKLYYTPSMRHAPYKLVAKTLYSRAARSIGFDALVHGVGQVLSDPVYAKVRPLMWQDVATTG